MPPLDLKMNEPHFIFNLLDKLTKQKQYGNKNGLHYILDLKITECVYVFSIIKHRCQATVKMNMAHQIYNLIFFSKKQGHSWIKKLCLKEKLSCLQIHYSPKSMKIGS